MMFAAVRKVLLALLIRCVEMVFVDKLTQVFHIGFWQQTRKIPGIFFDDKLTKEASMLLKGRPFDFWGGVWVISEKNILQTDSERKKSCMEIPDIEEKNSITEGLGTKLLPKPKH